MTPKPNGRQRQWFNGASSVRVLIVQILFSIAVYAGGLASLPPFDKRRTLGIRGHVHSQLVLVIPDVYSRILVKQHFHYVRVTLPGGSVQWGISEFILLVELHIGLGEQKLHHIFMSSMASPVEGSVSSLIQPIYSNFIVQTFSQPAQIASFGCLMHRIVDRLCLLSHIVTWN